VTIPMANAEVTEEDIAAVVDVMRSGRLTMGLQTEEFERAMAERCGARYGIAVNSGTAGLHLLALATGLKPGDEVITTSFSFVASTNIILYAGAIPVFIDIEPDTYCIDPTLIETAITPRTKAILAVDVFGHPADWDAILEIAQRRNLRVIADTCESLGARYKGRPVGSFGDGSVFAFFPNKQITTGEGGMIVTDDEQVARTCKALRNQGRDADSSWLAHAHLGYNYRIDELSAALGVSQLRRLDSIMAKRKQVADTYNALLSQESSVRTPREKDHVNVSYFVYVIELQGSHTREEVMQKLEERGIPSRGYFAPIHTQPYMRPFLRGREPHCPQTERIAQRTLALPFHTNMPTADVEFVVSALHDILNR